jgi:hypothetical protein
LHMKSPWASSLLQPSHIEDRSTGVSNAQVLFAGRPHQ